jgi:hypothetical protein
VGIDTRTWDRILFDPVYEVIGENLTGSQEKNPRFRVVFLSYFYRRFRLERGDYDLEAVILSTKSFFCHGNTNRNSEEINQKV